MACGRGPALSEEGQWMSLVGTWWELGRSDITDANLFFASSLTLLKLLFYGSVVEALKDGRPLEGFWSRSMLQSLQSLHPLACSQNRGASFLTDSRERA